MIKIFANSDKLNRFAAERFVKIANDSIRSVYNSFAVALAGGSTPQSLYRLLAGDEFKDKVNWSKVFFFFGDERLVPSDDKESNFRMANENLFAPLQIPEANIFRWTTENKDADNIAENYETAIAKFFALDEKEPIAKFDLMLLGMGDDGHTASLFPNTKALNEKRRNAVANPVEKLGTTRLTLTLPVINQARNVIFLVKGANKAKILQTVLEGDSDPDRIPAQAVKLESGELFWLIDEPAAKFLK
jgi:6-phosphogluconolactonase